MFYCERCKNTGKIQQEYVERPPLTEPVFMGIVKSIDMTPLPIKQREVECPDCLGFGAAGWALPG